MSKRFRADLPYDTFLLVALKDDNSVSLTLTSRDTEIAKQMHRALQTWGILEAKMEGTNAVTFDIAAQESRETALAAVQDKLMEISGYNPQLGHIKDILHAINGREVAAQFALDVKELAETPSAIEAVKKKEKAPLTTPLTEAALQAANDSALKAARGCNPKTMVSSLETVAANMHAEALQMLAADKTAEDMFNAIAEKMRTIPTHPQTSRMNICETLRGFAAGAANALGTDNPIKSYSVLTKKGG